jgi:hypothetical protein
MGSVKNSKKKKESKTIKEPKESTPNKETKGTQQTFKYYPQITDPDFELKLNRKKEIRIHKQSKPKTVYTDDTDPMVEACTKRVTGVSSLLPQQEFVKKFLNINTIYTGLLMFWSTGVGKTRGALAITESYIDTMRQYYEQGHTNACIYVIASEEAHNNFVKELIGAGAGTPERYATKEEIANLNALKGKKDAHSQDVVTAIQKDFKKRLTDPSRGGYYQFIGYELFANMTMNTHKNAIDTLDNCLLVIDEAHRTNNDNKRRSAIVKMLRKSKNVKVILMTATPMNNNATEIVPILNLLLPKERELNRNELFTDNILREGALEKIKSASRGYVTYIRGDNALTFPESIEMGELINPEFRFTKLIRCNMTDIHYNTFKALGVNNIGNDVQNVLDIVFPAPPEMYVERSSSERSDYGIFTHNDIALYKTASKQWLNDNGIRLIERKDSEINDEKYLVTGTILEVDNLKKYSTKYATVMRNLIESLNPDSGLIFIYNESIGAIRGIKQFEEILKMNGFGKYNPLFGFRDAGYDKSIRCVKCGINGYEHSDVEHSDEHVYTPALYIVLEGDTEKQMRAMLIDRFKRPSNMNGDEIKLVLGSEVTTESIDFAFIREIHILRFQWNMSTIEQIKGRGVRNCSHYLLEANKRNVKIYKYASTLPVTKESYIMSPEEAQYLEAERNHIEIKKVERVLKESAVDCLLNKDVNTSETDVDNSMKCDYQNCAYKCIIEAKYANTITPDDTDTFNAYFYEDEIDNVKQIIKKAFKYEPIMTVRTIINVVRDTITTDVHDNTIIIAIGMIVDDNEIMYNRFSEQCTMRLVNSNDIYKTVVIIVPSSINAKQSISVDSLYVPRITKVNQMINVQDYLDTIVDKNDGFRHSALVNKISNENNFIVVQKELDELDIAQQADILERVIETNDKTTPYNRKILKNYKNILLTEVDINSRDYSIDQYSVDSIYNVDKKIIGHHLLDKPRCYTINNGVTVWNTCTYAVLDSKKRQEFKENDYIVGMMEKNRHGKVVFKLKYVDATVSNDKRKIKKGFECSSVSKKDELLTIMQKLNIRVPEKGHIDNICKMIEMELRFRQQESIKKKEYIRWFYNHWELSNKS